jgi:hypothetical protein
MDKSEILKEGDVVEEQQIWSWALGAAGLTGLYLAGKKSWSGWCICFLTQIAWAAYGWRTHQYGFIVSSIGYGFINGKNMLSWVKEPPQ